MTDNPAMVSPPKLLLTARMSNTPVALLLSKLPDAKRSGKGWSAGCPAHEDRRASLSISQGDNGGAVLHCHAGCESAAVVAAIELTLADLMPARVEPTGGKAKANGKPKIVATYNYVDEQRKLLYQVVRFEPKNFRQRRPKDGGWEYSVKGTRLVPYRLPDLLTAPLSRGVLVVEGEADVDRAASIGIVATTCAMGAGKWRPEYNEHFRGRSIYIVPDNDKPGREHAQQVAMSLHGIAKSIKVVADFIHEGAAALGCDESYIALPLLAGLASAVGNSRRIRLKRTWCEPATIWAVAVGESGTLKSPGEDLATKPIHRLQNTALKQYGDQVEDYNRDQVLYDADLAEWKKSGRKKGEPPPEPPSEPVAVRYLVSDCTVEALAVLLEQRPRGLLVARDELSGWVNSFDAYKSCRGADVAHWLSMHRAGPLTVDRKSGKRTIHVPRASVCIAGGVQPKVLVAALVGRYQPQDAAPASRHSPESPGQAGVD